MPFDESACNVDQASMSIDMIGAVLCVIFKNKNDAFFPDPAVAQIIDKKTDCEVVIGNFCDRRRASQLKTLGMIVDESERVELRDRSCRKKRIKIPFPLPEPGRVHHRLIPARIIRAKMFFKNRNIRFVVISKFAVCTVRDSRPAAKIPDKTVFIIRDFAGSLGVVCAAAAAVIRWPVFFKVVGCIGAEAPVMSVSAYFSVDIKIIEKNKFFYKCMLVWRYFFSKKDERGIVCSVGYITHHLIVCSVFFNDIKNMLDRRWIAHFEWNRISIFAGASGFFFFRIRRISVHHL